MRKSLSAWALPVFGHPAVVHVEDQIVSMSVRVLLEEVTRIELQLCEALRLHQLLLGCAMPNSACVGLAVQRLQQFPDNRDSAIVKETFVGWWSYEKFPVVAFKCTL
eukprot:4424088-Pleurochrysis_carterae.AAC.1